MKTYTIIGHEGRHNHIRNLPDHLRYKQKHDHSEPNHILYPYNLLHPDQNNHRNNENLSEHKQQPYDKHYHFQPFSNELSTEHRPKVSTSRTDTISSTFSSALENRTVNPPSSCSMAYTSTAGVATALSIQNINTLEPSSSSREDDEEQLVSTDDDESSEDYLDEL